MTLRDLMLTPLRISKDWSLVTNSGPTGFKAACDLHFNTAHGLVRFRLKMKGDGVARTLAESKIGQIIFMK